MSAARGPRSETESPGAKTPLRGESRCDVYGTEVVVPALLRRVGEPDSATVRTDRRPPEGSTVDRFSSPRDERVP